MPKIQTNSTFQAGAGKAIISPKLGTRLHGYPSDRFATYIHDDLTATASALSDGNETAVLVSVTVCGIPTALCQRLTDMIGETLGIRNLIFSATHTHSGPALNSTPGWGDADEEYIETVFIPNVIKAVADAVGNLEDAKMGIGETETKTGINRREVTPTGGVRIGLNPLGIYDPRMRVITFVSADETRSLGTIVHFGAHGTAAGGPHPDSPLTRDWSGVMTDRIEWITGAPCAFLNGAEGDVAPRNFNRILRNGQLQQNCIQQAMEIGGMAAVDASEAFFKIKTYFTPELKIQTGQIRLPYEPLPDMDTVRERLRQLDAQELPAHMAYHAQYERSRWEKVLAEEGKEKKEAFSYSQILVQLGPVVFVPHPYEIFTAIAVRLDHFSPVDYTLSLSNANGDNGYLPNKEEFDRGGYEVWSSRYGTAYILTKDADSEIIKQNLALIQEMQTK